MICGDQRLQQLALLVGESTPRCLGDGFFFGTMCALFVPLLHCLFLLLIAWACVGLEMDDTLARQSSKTARSCDAALWSLLELMHSCVVSI